MRYLRMRTTPDSEAAPAVFQLLAASDSADEARLLEWNLAAECATVLFSVDGDPEAFEKTVPDLPLLQAVEVAPTGEDHFYLLLSVDPSGREMAEGVFETVSKAGLVVLKPVLYRDGRVHIRLVGDATTLQRAVDEHPEDIAVEIQAVGESFTTPEVPAALLSDRQREAVEVALDVGYYDDPRGATHADVAERLSCAPSTAGDHLKKAEAKLVRAGMDVYTQVASRD